MKLVLAALLLCAAGLKADGETQCNESISDQCPATDPPAPVFLPVPEHCSQYCECSGGIAWLFTCGEDLLFDDELLICDWYFNVECGDRPNP